MTLVERQDAVQAYLTGGAVRACEHVRDTGWIEQVTICADCVLAGLLCPLCAEAHRWVDDLHRPGYCDRHVLRRAGHLVTVPFALGDLRLRLADGGRLEGIDVVLIAAAMRLCDECVTSPNERKAAR